MLWGPPSTHSGLSLTTDFSPLLSGLKVLVTYDDKVQVETKVTVEVTYPKSSSGARLPMGHPTPEPPNKPDTGDTGYFLVQSNRKRSLTGQRSVTHPGSPGVGTLGARPKRRLSAVAVGRAAMWPLHFTSMT